MVHLSRASRELYRRSPDECFATVEDFLQHTRDERESSQDRWHLPQVLAPRASTDQVTVSLGDEGPHLLNHWSFAQLCRLAGINIDTVNRLSPETASRALQETLPSAEKPLQLLTTGNMVRSLHGVVYTRLWNADLLSVIREYASDFEPPQTGINGATGLYCGQQDLFAFLIDPTGWTEIAGEAFAPGFFVWNSEVGRRSLGIQTFWFQSICRNHIVWDAVEIVDFTRKHTAKVQDGLTEIRRIIEMLVEKRDQRRNAFVRSAHPSHEPDAGTGRRIG